jgi:ABC-type multidrug transport system ATPase subunit
MFLVCPKCQLAAAEPRKKSGFQCPHCRHAWEPPTPDLADAYYCELADVRVSLVANNGERFYLNSLPCILGRDSEFKALQGNRAVSRNHFQIQSDDGNGRLFASDLSSKGGTYLNDTLLSPETPLELKPGDTLRVSGVELKCEFRFQPAGRQQGRIRASPSTLRSDGRVRLVGGKGSAADIVLPLDSTDVVGCFYETRDGWRVLGIAHGRVLLNGEPFLDRRLTSQDELNLCGASFLYSETDSMLVPYEPESSLGFGVRGIVVAVGEAEDRRRILDGVDMQIPAGKLTGIIGPSGSGKSTLLKVLGGWLEPDLGEFFLDGQPVKASQYQKTMAGRLAFVPQDDIIHGELTLLDTLRYAAALRLGNRVRPAEKAERIRKALDELELNDHQHKRITELSGGQRKRANVAVELLSSPSVLLLDEPTTGLDTRAESNIIQCLHRLSRQGRTVVFITHSISVVDDTDHVVFLDAVGDSGRVLLQGSPARLKEENNIQNWADLFARRKPLTPPPKTAALEETIDLSEASLGASRFLALFLRYVSIWLSSSWSSFLSLLALPAILGLLVKIALPSSGKLDTDAILFAVISALWIGMNQSVREIVRERTVLVREHFAGVGSSGYILSKLLFFTLLGFLQSVLLATPILLLGIKGGWIPIIHADSPSLLWVEFQMTLWLGVVVGSAFGLLISAACLFIRSKGEIVAVLVVILVMLPQILFSDKVLVGGLTERTDNLDYYTFQLPEGTNPLPRLLTYGTASRYLYLPLKATRNELACRSLVWRFNLTILALAVLISVIVTWLLLEIFFQKQRRETRI